MNDPDIFKNLCPLCKKRKAERLCDYVVNYNSLIFYRNLSDFVNQERYDTCDLPMCKECTTKYNGFDFCPHHNKIHQDVCKQPKQELEIARHKEEVRQYVKFRKETDLK